MFSRLLEGTARRQSHTHSDGEVNDSFEITHTSAHRERAFPVQNATVSDPAGASSNIAAGLTFLRAQSVHGRGAWEWAFAAGAFRRRSMYICERSTTH